MVKESWLERLARNLDAVGGETLRQEVMQGSEGLSSGSSPSVKARWVRGMLERLEARFDADERRQILSACSCAFSQAVIQNFKHAYEQGGSLESLVESMRAEQRADILRRLGADEELHRKVEPEPYMHSPVLCEDGTILHTGRPYHPRDTLLAEDAQTRRQHMCHCGWISGSREDVSLTFCNCGSGFYRALWESLVGSPVEVRVESSVFSGGQYCQMRVKLPVR